MVKNTELILKIIRSQPYHDRIDNICGTALEVVLYCCGGSYAYSDKYANHDRIIIGARDDVIKWCKSNGVELNNSWLFTDLHLRSKELAQILATDILGAKLLSWVAEAVKRTMPLLSPQVAIEEVLEVSLETIVERYLCQSIVWATSPDLNAGTLSQHLAKQWFRVWTTSNAVTKPSWAQSAPTTHVPSPSEVENMLIGDIKPPEPKKLPLTAMVHRVHHPSANHTAIGYVGNLPLADESDIDDLGQMIRPQFGAGEYSVQICQENTPSTGFTRILKTINVMVAEDNKHVGSHKKPHIMLPPAEKIPLNTSAPAAQPKKPRAEKQPDVFAAAISGALFKKPIEEP